MPDVELAPEGGPAQTGEEEARQFIFKVKKIIERCLGQRMNKEEMFRAIREEGLPTWVAFAVFKELREQNYGFFKEYYAMHDLKEQREKLGRLIQAYSTRGVMETDTTARMEMEMELSDQQGDDDASLDRDLARLLAASMNEGGDQLAGAASPQLAVRSPGAQQPHDDQQMAYSDWLLGWSEEAVPIPVPMPAGQQLLNDEQEAVASGMFQGVASAWPQQGAHHPPALPQLPCQEQPVHMPALPQLPACQEQPGHMLALPELPCQDQAGQLPAGQLVDYLQQEEVNLPAQQQVLDFQYQEHMMANGGFNGAPPTLSAGLPSVDFMMDPCTLSQDGIGWVQELEAEPPQQWCSGAYADPSPSSTLPGGELLGNQNFPTGNADIHERP